MAARTSIAFLTALLGLLLPVAAPQADVAHEALVIGNATYTALPQLPGCLLSAHAVAAALRGAGFAVVEREDASSGGTDAAIGEFSAKLAHAPGSAAFVYACGYVTAFNDRPFLLPVSANIARPADVLTQGVLAKTLTDVLTRGGAGASIVALDAVAAPDAPPDLALASLIQAGLPDGAGLVAARQANPSGTPTPLATALVTQLKRQSIETAPLLAELQQQLSRGAGATLVALHEPAASGYLAGAPPAPPPPVTAAAPPPPGPTGVSHAPSPEVTPMPDEDQMTEADRRRIQTALSRLGYYDGAVDGIFGPDTRAAIRRYQHELGADMSGRLTGAQATKLVNGR